MLNPGGGGRGDTGGMEKECKDIGGSSGGSGDRVGERKKNGGCGWGENRM